MKTIRMAVTCLFLGVSGLFAATAETHDGDDLLPGVTLSQGITEITGVAISPLLGVSTVGAWQYWNAPSERRAGLPWYCQPWAWGFGFGVLGLCFLKDTAGAAMPGLLKKPFDMVELFENKASALMASATFVPLVANQMAVHFRAGHEEVLVPAAALTGAVFAGIDIAWLMVPASIVAFLMVWICSHAINVLIILSPFSTVDSLLKLLRMGLLAGVALLYALAPWVAAALCLIIIAVAAWLAPAALRLAIFGARFAGDILLPWRGKARAEPESPHAFTLGRMNGLPPRTGGRLILLDDGSKAFRYRRLLMLDERTIPLPVGSHYVEKGLLAPSLLHQSEGRDNGLKLLLFLPRYRGHEETMVGHLKLHGVRKHAFARSFAAIRQWLRGILGGNPA